MKKLIIGVMILVLMVMATVVLAAPSESSPWELYDYNMNGETPDFCDYPSPGTFDGEWYQHYKADKIHCFKT